MVKIYLRYSLKTTFGVVASIPSNVIFDGTGKCAITGALEHVLIWDIKKGVKVAGYVDSELKKQPIVSQIALSPDKVHLAAGYSNGMIRVWNLRTGLAVHSFAGHKSEVTALSFDGAGQLLVSGSHDTDIILWDMVTDTGLFKLRGHKNSITDIKFLEKDGSRLVVSSSKDCLVKIWDLDTQHCVQTIVGHRAEVWSFDINPEQNRLVTLSEDSLRFYRLESPNATDNDENDKEKNPTEQEDKDKMQVDESLLDETESRAFFFGVVPRKAKERGARVRYNLDGSAIAVQSAGKTVEFLRVHAKEEIKERRKIRFAREKTRAKRAHAQALKEHAKMLEQLRSASKTYTEVTIPDEPKLEIPEKVKQPADEVSHAQLLRIDAKIHSTSWSQLSTKEFILSTSANTIEHYKINIKPRQAESKKDADSDEDAQADVEVDDESDRLGAIEMPGHRSDVRALALSANNEMLVSTSNGLVKVWNVRSLAPIRTIQSGYGLCVAYAPGDRHIVVGTKTGQLELFDLQSARLLETIDAHTAPIWSVQVHPDGKSFVSASADKKLKFWSFDVVTEEPANESSLVGAKRLGITHVKTFELTDDALACKFSRNGQYLAVALLDSTVKIFVVSSMKLFHTLYGHKLPVMSLDIADDGAIIVTGSADKNIRIWGMDFGDCHKSIFAHSDSVMGLAFVPDTHYFFSVGKDGLLKYWDADTFEHVLTLEGHQAETWALAVATDGNFVVTGSHDRSLRVWERTEDQVVASDERETEIEQAWEATMEAEDKYATEDKAESAKPTKQTLASIKSGEKLIDALEIIAVEEENLVTYNKELEKAKSLGVKDFEKSVAKPTRNELMLGKTPQDFLLHTITSIRSSDLDESLLLLPLSMVLKLIGYLDNWVKQDVQLELCSRILFFLIRMYQTQISANKSIQHTLHSLRENIRTKLVRHKDMIGFNQVALNHIKRTMELESNVKFFEAREQAFLQLGAKKQKVTRKNYWE